MLGIVGLGAYFNLYPVVMRRLWSFCYSSQVFGGCFDYEITWSRIVHCLAYNVIQFPGCGLWLCWFYPWAVPELPNCVVFNGCRSSSVWVPSKFLILSFVRYYGVINFLSTGIVISTVLSTEVYFWMSHACFIVLQNLQNLFHFGG